MNTVKQLPVTCEYCGQPAMTRLYANGPFVCDYCSERFSDITRAEERLQREMRRAMGIILFVACAVILAAF